MRGRSAPLLLSALLIACRGSRPPPDERACAYACATLAGAGCAESETATCRARCREERAQATRAECITEYDAFLACLGREVGGCNARAGESVAHGIALTACQSQYGTYARCTVSCREHGVVRSADRTLRVDGAETRVQSELTTRGCGQALPAIRRGAPPGSRCEYQSVCEPVMCPCPSPTEGYRVRACIDGACASETRACRLGPLAVGQELCRPVAKTAP